MEQPEYTMGTRETGGGSVLLKKLDSCQPCVTFTQMDALFPDSCDHFQQDNESKLFEDHSEAEASTDISPADHFWDALNEQVRSMKNRTILQHLVSHNLLLTAWCQKTQQNFRGCVESMFREVRTGLTAKVGLIE